MSDEHRKARRRGKDFERAVARALGGKRRGNRGVCTSDIDGLPWSVECTRTIDGSGKWNQAVRNAKLEGQEPVLIRARPRQRLDDALVTMRFRLFRELVEAGDGR